MKTLSKILITGLIAFGLSACGSATPTTSGYYNSAGQWVSTAGVGTGNACISSMSQPLSLGFTATGINSQVNRFFAGTIPSFGSQPGTYGTVSLAGGYGAQTMGATTMSAQNTNGQIQMSLSTQSMTASGTIMIQPQALYNSGILNSIYNTGIYGSMGGSTVCITAIALDVVYIAQPSYYGGVSTGVISQALVYLYLSNGQVAQAPIAI